MSERSWAINPLLFALTVAVGLLFFLNLFWLAGPLFGFLLLAALLALGFYPAPEDAVGVVYWRLFGNRYVDRFVAPRTFTLVVPFLQQVEPIHTRRRTSEIVVSDVLTLDQRPVDVRALCVFYVYAANVDPAHWHELTHMTDVRWAMMVNKVGIQAVQEAVRRYTFDALFQSGAFTRLGNDVRVALNDFLRTWGIDVAFVNVQDVRPSKGFADAVRRRAAAAYDAEATRARVEALVDVLLPLADLVVSALHRGHGPGPDEAEGPRNGRRPPSNGRPGTRAGPPVTEAPLWGDLEGPEPE